MDYLDALSSPGLAGNSCFGALHSRELPGASLSLFPSHTCSIRALSFPPDLRPPEKMLLMSSVTSGTHCALFLLANMTHTVVCVGYNWWISMLFLHLSLGEICIRKSLLILDKETDGNLEDWRGNDQVCG